MVSLFKLQQFRWLTFAIIFIVGVLIAYALLSTIPGFVGNDDYYHSRIAAQIVEQRNPRIDFPWLPLTILNQDQFVDHHLLYHLYLGPWMVLGGVTGVKIAQSLVLGAIAITIWSLLRYLRVNLPIIWTLALLALSTPFLYRMLMIRTQAFAVLLLLMTLHMLFRRRYRWLIVLGFGFTWLFNGFVLLPAVVFLYSVSAWITDREIAWKAILFVVLGVTLGLIVNPYFPQNIAFIIDHLREKVDISTVQVGSEWYPYTTANLLENSLGAVLALAIGLLAGSFRKTGRDHIETSLLFIALLTLYMLFRSRRFIEYFPIFSLLYCAVAWGRVDIEWRDALPKFVPYHSVRYLFKSIFIIVVLLLAVMTVNSVHNDIQDTKGIDYMAGASAWLQVNTEPGTMVFQTDWDDFTHLFYHNTQNTYLVGLDPTYLQIAEPFLWNQWVALTQGMVERPSVIIRETFGATIVVSDMRHDTFSQQADEDPAMTLVYRDANSLIWRIGDDK